MDTAQCGGEPLPATEKRFAPASRLYPANWFPADWCWNPRTLTPMLVLLKLTKPACVFSCEFSLLLRLQPAATRSSSSSDSTTGWMSSSMVLSLDVSGAVLRPRYNLSEAANLDALSRKFFRGTCWALVFILLPGHPRKRLPSCAPPT